MNEIRVGKIIKELRRNKGFTLVELARHSGVQLATLSRIENDKMAGTLNSYFRIAYALGIELSDLFREIKTSDYLDPFLKNQAETVIKNE